jgi:hypothetical protein
MTATDTTFDESVEAARQSLASVTYILPILRSSIAVDQELTQYLASIAGRCELIVVDGSAPDAFAAAHRAWSGLGLHVPVDRSMKTRNGKVGGVLTGVALATNEYLVIADDDVRYDAASLDRTIEALADADLVRPQNYFRPHRWHTHWDTARTLLNRVLGGVDFPGTLAVRRSMLERTNGYDGDVLFENLELIRTVKAAGGRVASPPALYVARRPPETRHFLAQRPRHAYDEFARPWRFASYLAVLPLVGWRARRRPGDLAVAAAVAIAIAEIGRRRAGGAKVFPARASLLAPAWLLERAVCSWIAVGARMRGGVRYGSRRIPKAAHSTTALRRHMRAGTAERVGQTPGLSC